MIESGILLVDKPSGITSAQVVHKIKKQFSIKKIGHAGTLDPMATGLLVVLVGKATKQQSDFLNATKGYEGVILLGRRTTTDDIEGDVLEEKEVSPSFFQNQDATCDQLKEKFSGPQEQVPPVYSAIKISGKRSYRRARDGEEVSHVPRSVEIYSLDLTFIAEDKIKFSVRCSKGTYIRSLARDIGEFLQTGGCLFELRRTFSEPFLVEKAEPLADLLKRDCKNSGLELHEERVF